MTQLIRFHLTYFQVGLSEEWQEFPVNLKETYDFLKCKNLVKDSNQFPQWCWFNLECMILYFSRDLPIDGPSSFWNPTSSKWIWKKTLDSKSTTIDFVIFTKSSTCDALKMWSRSTIQVKKIHKFSSYFKNLHLKKITANFLNPGFWLCHKFYSMMQVNVDKRLKLSQL